MRCCSFQFGTLGECFAYLVAIAIEKEHLWEAFQKAELAYRDLEITAADSKCAHQEAHDAVEERTSTLATRVSTLEGENVNLQGVVTVARSTCQATYLQAEAPESSMEVASLLAGVPTQPTEIAEQGLLTGAEMALVAAKVLYAYVDIRSVTGAPINIELTILKDLHQKAIEPTEALIAMMNHATVIQDSLLEPLDEQDNAQGQNNDQEDV